MLGSPFAHAALLGRLQQAPKDGVRLLIIRYVARFRHVATEIVLAAESFEATRCHELLHWSGASHRLDRGLAWFEEPIISEGPPEVPSPHTAPLLPATKSETGHDENITSRACGRLSRRQGARAIAAIAPPTTPFGEAPEELEGEGEFSFALGLRAIGSSREIIALIAAQE
jgi:hypothetical protein